MSIAELEIDKLSSAGLEQEANVKKIIAGITRVFKRLGGKEQDENNG